MADVTMKKWVWKSYDLAFELPSTFSVKVNTKKTFMAEDGFMTIAIIPWNNSSLSAQDVAMAAYNDYSMTTTKTILQQGAGNDISSGFESYIIFAKGEVNDKILYFAILGLIDPDSPTNLYARFSWWDNHSQNNYYDKLSATVAKSIKKTTKTNPANNNINQSTSNNLVSEQDVINRFKQVYLADWVSIKEMYDSVPDFSSCSVGKLKNDEKIIALDYVNFIRALHGLKPVNYSYKDDIYTAQGSLVCAANNKLSHKPDKNWKCWTQQGYDGCSSSNVFGGSFITDSYSTEFILSDWIIDGGDHIAGHRRWMLDPFLKYMSYGRVDVTTPEKLCYSLIKVMGFNDLQDNSDLNIEYVAYPYQYYPAKLVNLENGSLSFEVLFDKKNEWGNSKNKVDYTNTKVEIYSQDGKKIDVYEQTTNYDGFGLPNHLSWRAKGLEKGVRYNVSIKNVNVNKVNKTYTYFFKIVE